MFVGILRLTLSIPGARSLKDKRRVLHKLIERARARYNAAIAEVGENDNSQRAQLGAAVVANDRRFVDEVLAKLTRDVEANADASLLAREVEIESYAQMQGAPADKPDLDPTAEELAEESGWDLEAEERMMAAADASTSPESGRASVGGGDAGGVGESDEAFGESASGAGAGGWLTESDFEGDAK